METCKSVSFVFGFAQINNLGDLPLSWPIHPMIHGVSWGFVGQTGPLLKLTDISLTFSI